jgi:hypothetical protein
LWIHVNKNPLVLKDFSTASMLSISLAFVG